MNGSYGFNGQACWLFSMLMLIDNMVIMSLAIPIDLAAVGVIGATVARTRLVGPFDFLRSLKIRIIVLVMFALSQDATCDHLSEP